MRLWYLPQPAIVVVRPPLERYAHRHPLPEDILLIVEVASTTLKTDRTLKLRLYASAGIPEYWIIDLQREQLAVYRTPETQTGRYLDHEMINQGEPVQPMLREWDITWSV